MNDIAAESKTPFWLIMIGACIFILMLAVSAYWEADIRWLHFFQSWMYIGTVLLSFRRIRWGYFMGVSAAGLWDYTNVFATTFLYNGLEELSRWIHSGHLQRPDLTYCHSRLVFKLAGRDWLRLGLLPSAREIMVRQHKIRDYIRSDNCLLCT
jgi:hypothetical protein